MINKKLLKIFVPFAMLIAIVGIYLLQNSATAQTEETTMQSTEITHPLNVTSVNLSELTTHGLPIIIDFGADECEPCKDMAPVLVSLNEEMQGKAIIQFVDVWKNPEAAGDFPVQLIPTQFFVDASGAAYVPSDEIQEQIQFIFYGHNETQEHIYTVHQGGLTQEQMLLILSDMGVV